MLFDSCFITIPRQPQNMLETIYINSTLNQRNFSLDFPPVRMVFWVLLARDPVFMSISIVQTGKNFSKKNLTRKNDMAG